MKTMTLYFPNKLRAKLMLEVEENGSVVRALSLDTASGEWVSASAELYNRPEILEEVKVDIALGRWESETPIKDRVAEIIGVKHA